MFSGVSQATLLLNLDIFQMILLVRVSAFSVHTHTTHIYMCVCIYIYIYIYTHTCIYSRTSNNGHCRGIQILSVIGGVR
jgi:hypothetical protein